MSGPTQLASDPLMKRLRKLAGNGYEWLHDVADRIEQLQMPHAEVIRLSEVGDDGADSAALIKALCKKVEAQRKRLAALESTKCTRCHCQDNARLVLGDPTVAVTNASKT